MIETLQVPAELDAMTDLYRERKPSSVLEIGVWQGGTLKVWLEHAAPEASISAVDLDHHNIDLYTDWLTDSELHLFTGSSTSDEGKRFIRERAPYDWVFVDGDHGPLGVTIDVETVLPLISSGGLLLLHDIVPPMGFDTYQPLQEFEKLEDRHEAWAYIDDVPGYESAHGIGVVQL